MTSFLRRTTVVLAMAFACIGVPPVASAQDVPAGPLVLKGSVTFVSDYRLRGVSQSGGDPAIQASLDLNHASGVYAGAWASSLGGGSGPRGSMELDLYAGYSREVAPGITADAGLLYYAYPDGSGGPADFFEPYASLAGSLGPARLKLGVNYAWSQAALGGDDNLYLYSNVDVAVPGTPLTLLAHGGYQDGALSGPARTGSLSRHGWDWSVGANAAMFGRLTAGLAWAGTSGPKVDGLTGNAVVATLSAAF